MYSGQTISLKTLLWKIMRNPIAEDLSYEEAAEHAVEGLRLIGAPLLFEDVVTNPPLEILNYKVKLPPNLLNIRGVRIINNLQNYDDGAIALRYATDIYHTGNTYTTSGNEDLPYEYTYTIQKGILFTSIPEGHIQISYKALSTDEEGYPLIPNDQKTLLALEYYILHRFLEPLWIMGKITDKAFSYIETKRHFYMGGADTSLKLQGPDHLQSIVNTINRLIINDRAHESFYKGSGQQERIRRY
jgi:hypothetical protein